MRRLLPVRTVAALVLVAACPGEDPASAPGRLRPRLQHRSPTGAGIPAAESPTPGPVRVPVSGDTTWVHDPSIACVRTAPATSTPPGGIQHRTSTDLQHWTRAAPVFAEAARGLTQEARSAGATSGHPTSAAGVAGGTSTTRPWFPGRLAEFRNSAIGHATAVTLDPSSPGTADDRPRPVPGQGASLLDADRSGWNAIDPVVVLDDDDRPCRRGGPTTTASSCSSPARREPSTVGAPGLPGPPELVTDNIEAPGPSSSGVDCGTCLRRFEELDLQRAGRSFRLLTGPHVDRDGRIDALNGGGTRRCWLRMGTSPRNCRRRCTRVTTAADPPLKARRPS